jgi:hypothetical protein
MNLLMMCLCLLTSSLLAFKESPAKLCTRQLENIIFSPPSAAKDYLFTLLDELTKEIRQYDTISEEILAPIYQSFAQRYNIIVSTISPIGTGTSFTSNFIIRSTRKFGFRLYAPTYLGIKSFEYNSNSQVFVAGELFRDSFGGFLTIALTLFPEQLSPQF